ncbi:MAG TPA: guanine deaminase [Kaistia sp.]|nr:guanine deaminase [Kaistia sp.]
MAARAIRGTVARFQSDPFGAAGREALVFEEDRLVVIKDGLIASVGPAEALLANLPTGTPVDHYPGAILSPGFIDAHVHYPQMEMIGAAGEELLAWLEAFTFPAEGRFADPAHADEVAGRFLRELLRAGTTTAAVYCTVHPHSVDAFFAESERFGTRMIAGKVLMDRNAPSDLTDTAASGIEESAALIARWHGKGRQLYAITPRFAPSCSEEQLEAAGRLWRAHPGTYVQTHLCENKAEIAWVAELFPERASYLDVYDHAGLTGPRAIFGHAVHMSEADFACCHRTGSVLAHCPTSNLFLGSGLFRLFEAKRADRPIQVALGTDLGAGTSFSQLQTMNEAYKVAKLGGTTLSTAEALWLATTGAAEALHLSDRIGAIEPGREADIIVLDPAATPLLQFRTAYCHDLAETLSVLMTLGDDRAVRATYVAGVAVYDRDRPGDPFAYPA